MRFLKDGPSIPDELLIARDEGRVVFFCGAGVSRARAGLSDFFGLAKQVTDDLGVPAGHSARKIIDAAPTVFEQTGVSGLISADRVFGLLERDFLTRDIEGAVAQALKPNQDVDLSAHKILLDLAKTPEGKIRLVTTNFDRLFESCNEGIQCFSPPHLPNPSRHDQMDGIIHLHGVTNDDYSGAEGEGFVLSSSEFGHAYLSEGWATRFIREILDRYIIVFVGYAADDPPVHYLLEALKKKAGKLEGVYAFQAGESSEEIARWKDKSVKAIAYNQEEEHQHLWASLEAWAKRARDVDAWYDDVLELGRHGPGTLERHERGQVAHIASTLDGSRRIAEADEQLPAEWLCVFDPYRRYDKSGHLGDSLSRGAYFDPFDSYGLDSDPVPKKIEPDSHYEKRDTPADVWNCFTATRVDLQDLHNSSYAELCGHRSINVPSLPPRIQKLAIWISNVSNDPGAVWWAAYQFGLHPGVQEMIRHRLQRQDTEYPDVVRKGWECLFEAWQEKKDDPDTSIYQILNMIKKNGWSSSGLRELFAAIKPRITAHKDFWGGPKPPVQSDELRLSHMVNLDVAYPDLPRDIEIPDEYLHTAVSELRRNLEIAVILEGEQGGYGLSLSNPIIPNENQEGGIGASDGLFLHLKYFVRLFEKLIDVDLQAARQERRAWPLYDDTIFARLRVWSAGLNHFVTTDEFVETFEGLSCNAFWNSYHQRDLLLALSGRWNELNEHEKVRIETILLKGRELWEGEDSNDFISRNAWGILERLYWLQDQGCTFTIDIEAKANELKEHLPDWQPAAVENAVRSLGSRGGVVKTVTDHSCLENVPINEILEKALKLSGKSDDFLIENDPFSGLVKNVPVHAFSALTDAARHGECPEWAWRSFLNSSGRQDDSPKFSALIGERICRHSEDDLSKLLHPLTAWFERASKNLYTNYPNEARKIFSKLVLSVQTHSEDAGSSIIRSSTGRDWVSIAINAPVGKLAEALMNDPQINDFVDGNGFPAGWLLDVMSLIELPDALRCHALVIFSFNMNWCYAKDPKWAEDHLLCELNKGTDDSAAVWDGFFWGAQGPNQSLFMRMKEDLLGLARRGGALRRDHNQVLSAIILQGWASVNSETGERFISSTECREVLLEVDDEFRSQVLWHIERWSGEGGEDNKWPEFIPKFLTEAWPRQKFVKTPKMSARLCDLAFSSGEQFVEIADIVLPLVTSIDSDRIRLPNLRKSKDSIVDVHPEKTLELLHAVLPDNVEVWPYEINDVLKRIGEADESLKVDVRLLELNRIWNSR